MDCPDYGILIETYGCQMNTYDSQAIFGLLAPAGFFRQKDELAADIILLNTCSVRDHAEQKILSRDGVTDVLELDTAIDTATRTVTISGRVLTDVGLLSFNTGAIS